MVEVAYMMNKKFIYFGILIIFTCVSLSIYQHELNHIFINEKVGIDSKLIFGFKDYIPAVGVQRLGEAQNKLSNLELAHSFNESINYNLTPLLIGIMLIIFLGFIHIVENIKELKK